MKIKSKLCLLLLVVSGFLLTGCAKSEIKDNTESAPTQETESTSAPESGNDSTAIAFDALDMEGNAVSAGIFAETKLTMVNVWATYCNPCLREMPGLGELAEEYAPEEFRIVGVISDVMEGADQKTIDLAADLIEQTGADYTHLLLNESLYYALLTDVTAVPTTFFINEDGEILDIVIGSMEKSAWEEKVNALLEEQ
ncbi:MAG: TlpA family protein disulfide reductase [Acetatifactor sp.]|nr:TlpA family protein disulfide reductase [Acetatifactor sp.]